MKTPVIFGHRGFKKPLIYYSRTIQTLDWSGRPVVSLPNHCPTYRFHHLYCTVYVITLSPFAAIVTGNCIVD